MRKSKYALWDTFNDKPISYHRTLEAAAKASAKEASYWSKHGNGSYIPTTVCFGDGSELPDSELEEVHSLIFCLEQGY